MKNQVFKFDKKNLVRLEILTLTEIDLSLANSVVRLKDGRFLLTYQNGFSYYVLNRNKTIDRVSEDWYKDQLSKNRLTKKHLRTNV